jgi:SAM-dependent methyltransferase
MTRIDPDDPQQRLQDFGLLRRILRDYDPADVDDSMSPNDTMIGHNYMWVGASAAESIIAAVAASRLTRVEAVLDLPCGHGRVLRHLARMFPEAALDACDLDKDGVAFCAQTFGARPILSQEDLTQVRFDRKYDLIWIGSLFTHTSQSVTERWLTYLSEQLSDTGIIVATFHGRFTPIVHCLTPYIDEERWRIVMDGYRRTGYGYADYAEGVSHAFIEGSYGLSVTRPSTLLELVGRIPGVRIHHYQERGWGNNQDVIAFGPPHWDDSTWPHQEPPLLPDPEPAPAASSRLGKAREALSRLFGGPRNPS